MGPHATTEQSWSRQGPMGPLLDPKLYPSRVGRSPEVDTMRYNQPNVFLKKVNLEEILKDKHNNYIYAFSFKKNIHLFMKFYERHHQMI